MVNKRQNSIQWLENEVYKIINEYEPFAFSYYLEKVFEQAKEIEKEQIINAFKNGDSNGTFETINAEEYYNETFKQE